MKHLVILILLSISLAGFSQQNAQERAEIVVKKHLSDIFKSDYKSYGFSELFKTSTPRIMEVEDIKEKIIALRKSNLLSDSVIEKYDALVKLKIDTIKANKEFPTYDITHYYVVKEEGKEYLYQTKFHLYPDGKLKDINQLMKFEFVNKEHDWFYGYYRRNPALPSDLEENKRVFQYLDDLLENEENRELIMATVINTYAIIAVQGYLDTVNLPRILAARWIRQNIPGVTSITDYSPVKPIVQDGETIGYNVFIRFKEKEEIKVYYFEFDTTFIQSGALPVEKPYESYFIKK